MATIVIEPGEQGFVVREDHGKHYDGRWWACSDAGAAMSRVLTLLAAEEEEQKRRLLPDPRVNAAKGGE